MPFLRISRGRDRGGGLDGLDSSEPVGEERPEPVLVLRVELEQDVVEQHDRRVARDLDDARDLDAFQDQAGDAGLAERGVVAVGPAVPEELEVVPVGPGEAGAGRGLARRGFLQDPEEPGLVGAVAAGGPVPEGQVEPVAGQEPEDLEEGLPDGRDERRPFPDDRQPVADELFVQAAEDSGVNRGVRAFFFSFMALRTLFFSFTVRLYRTRSSRYRGSVWPSRWSR